MEGDTTRMRSEFENELNENKVQFARIRDKNKKFHSMSVSKVSVIFTKRVFSVSILKLTQNKIYILSLILSNCTLFSS